MVTLATSAEQKILAAMQVRVDSAMFSKTPVHIIERYLEHFNSDGELARHIPSHVLEALAGRFRLFLDKESSLMSLDEAFGGQTGRQRKNLFSSDLKFEIAYQVMQERERIRGLKGPARGNGTPHDLACANVGAKHGMSGENVRRLFKEAKLG